MDSRNSDAAGEEGRFRGLGLGFRLARSLGAGTHPGQPLNPGVVFPCSLVECLGARASLGFFEVWGCREAQALEGARFRAFGPPWPGLGLQGRGLLRQDNGSIRGNLILSKMRRESSPTLCRGTPKPT